MPIQDTNVIDGPNTQGDGPPPSWLGKICYKGRIKEGDS